MSENETEREYSIEQIEELLTDINQDLTQDNLDEVMLNGELGFHIFATTDNEHITDGFNKKLHSAFDRAIQELWIDDEIVEDYHGEVTPETVIQTVQNQMDDFYGMNGLKRRLVDELRDELNENEDEE